MEGELSQFLPRLSFDYVVTDVSIIFVVPNKCYVVVITDRLIFYPVIRKLFPK